MKSTSGLLDDVVRSQHSGRAVGAYSVCSAHPWVLEAAIKQAIDDRTALIVESTSNQINQFGGYTGQTPAIFAEMMREMAKRLGLHESRLLLGGDHLGPHPFRKQPADEAMAQAADMVRAYVAAGYEKIHLDTSMACAGDAVDANGSPDESLAARRAAELCAAAEAEARRCFGSSAHLRYVVGTEVPPPGGETGTGAIRVTQPQDVRRTIDTTQAAFDHCALSAVWPRVIAVVVQPGVDFSDTSVIDYDRQAAVPLREAIGAHASLVYEAHSTDYQRPTALRALVEDHFAILKVGPWLTYALREALFALVAIEAEWLGHCDNHTLSRLRDVVDAVMVADPVHWRDHYRGDDASMRFARAYSYSDRIRYYWSRGEVAEAVARLMANLQSTPPPIALVEQHLPREYEQLREHGSQFDARAAVERAVRRVLTHYAQACKAEE